MSESPLHTYLNDHLAGSVMALELLDHLADAATSSDTQQFFRTLRAEIAADQDTPARPGSHCAPRISD
jgi:hypothetical protein